MHNVKIGIVGERNPKNPTHQATDRAFEATSTRIEWIATDRIGVAAEATLSRYGGLLISPGSPYRSMDGALAAIRYARERQVPLLGTCGGFQHLIVEFARNVCGIRDADHAETNPVVSQQVVTALACSLVGQVHPVRVIPSTRAGVIYGSPEVREPFFCNYGLNPVYRPLLESKGLQVSGVGSDGEVRIVELPAHPFFIGTLYVPQAHPKAGTDHLVIRAFIAACRERATSNRSV